MAVAKAGQLLPRRTAEESAGDLRRSQFLAAVAAILGENLPHFILRRQ